MVAGPLESARRTLAEYVKLLAGTSTSEDNLVLVCFPSVKGGADEVIR